MRQRVELFYKMKKLGIARPKGKKVTGIRDRKVDFQLEIIWDGVLSARM
jgi:hypothetical protein